MWNLMLKDLRCSLVEFFVKRSRGGKELQKLGKRVLNNIL